MSAINGNSWSQEVVKDLICAYQAGELEGLSASADSRPSALKQLLQKLHVYEVDLSLIELFKKQVDLLIRSDARKALEVAEAAESLSQLSLDTAARALGVRTKAMALHVLSRYAEAVEHYERARRLYREAGREVEMARVERAMVDALIYLGSYDQALELADEARQIFENHDEKLLLAQLESNVGNIYHRLDRNREALVCYNRAADVFAAANNRNGLALVSFNRANIYCNLDDFRQAQALYEQAYELHCAEENQLGAAQTRYSIGYLHFLRGAYHQAMRVLHEARIECHRLGDEQTAALCILDLAEIYLQLNILDEAARLAAQARELFEDLGMRYEAARALTFLGLSHMRQLRLDDAERSFALAREEFAAEGNEVHLGMISLYQAESRLLRERLPVLTTSPFLNQNKKDSDSFNHGEHGGHGDHQSHHDPRDPRDPRGSFLYPNAVWSDLEDAIKLAEEAETIFARQQLKAKTCSAQLVKTRALLSGGQQVQELCEKILQSCQELDTPWLRYQAHELLGDVLLAAGDIQQAQEHYTQAISFIEQIRSSIRVDEFRSAFFRDKLCVYEKLIGLCLDQENPERHADAFYYIESSKARTLVDLLINELELMPLPEDQASAELYQQWQSLREKLHWYHSKMNQAEMQGQSRLLSTDQRLHEEIVHCERAMSEVTRQLQASDPSFVWLQRSGGMKVEELRSILTSDETVIEYYFDAEQLKIFLIDRHSLRVVSSGHSLHEISDQIQNLRFQFDKFHYGPGYLTVHAERLRQCANDCLHQLWQALFAPVADLVRGNKLIFIPYGLLHNVPFQALFDGEKYLIESREIAQAPSAMLLKLCAERSPKNYERAVIFGAADETALHITEEIQAIRSLFPEGNCFTGTAATAQSLSDNAPSSDILHIASHAVFRHDNPMFSAFKLADRWLNFYDICAMKLPASLVILSGCNTGASRVYAGDELMGLARGFLSAGASSLVVSLWAVDDPATAKLMTALYQKLRSGTSTRAALRAAALEIKSLYNHPYYWAPFVLISQY